MSEGSETDDGGIGRVALTVARRGTDLFAAVEAAQYARLVDPVTPADGDQAREIGAFLALFCDCAETWDEKAPMEQTAALEHLDHRIEGLETAGLRVHWAVPQRSFITQQGESVPLPIALLKIRPADEAAQTTHVPLVLGLNER